MKILITGATGLIGNTLIPVLQKEQHTLSILTRNKQKVKFQKVAVYQSIDDIP